jgi:hypothetical protein
MCVSVCPPSDRRRGAVRLVACASAPRTGIRARFRALTPRALVQVCRSLRVIPIRLRCVGAIRFFYWVCWAGCALSGVGISCGHDCSARCMCRDLVVVRVLIRDVCLYGETGVRRSRRWTLALAARKARPGRAARVTCLCRCCARQRQLPCVMAAESVWWRARVRVVCSAMLAVCGEHARNRVLRVRLRCHTALWAAGRELCAL